MSSRHNRSAAGGFTEKLQAHLVARGFALAAPLDVAVPTEEVRAPPRGRTLAAFEARAEHAEQVGAALAHLHQAGVGFTARRRNLWDPPAVERLLLRSDARARRRPPKPPQLLADLELFAIEILRHRWPRQLPRGIIHGNLSLSHARFARGQLSALTDFSAACRAPYVLDIAMALLDWGFAHDQLAPGRARALVRGYSVVRPLAPGERAALFNMSRFAALRCAAALFYQHELAYPAASATPYRDYRHFTSRLGFLRRLGQEAFDATVGI